MKIKHELIAHAHSKARKQVKEKKKKSFYVEFKKNKYYLKKNQ
jgi:hypothetical protein